MALIDWGLWTCILLGLFLQIFLIVAGTFRRLASRRWFVKILWLVYLLAGFVAVSGLGFLVGRQSALNNYCKEGIGCYEDQVLMYWATFFLIHLGGPDTITAFPTEDNELWLRDLFYLSSKCITVAYAIYESALTSYKVRIPLILLFLYGLIKCIERTCALYYGSAKGFRNSIPSKSYFLVNNIPSEEDKLLIHMNKVTLSDIEVLQYAFVYFTAFKGHFVDLSLSIHDRNQSRDFFLARSREDAFRLVEVELNYLYDVLFTKIPVLHHKLGLCCRIISFIALVSSFVLFYSDFDKYPLGPLNIIPLDIHKKDKVVTCILFSGTIVLEVIAFYMLLFSDWTVVKLRPLFDAKSNRQLWKDKFIDCILYVNNTRSAIFHYVLRLGGEKDHPDPSKCTDGRWANSLSAFNLIFYCLHRCSKGREKIYTCVGLRGFLNDYLYVKRQPLTHHIAGFIFDELEMKSKKAGSLAVAKKICSSKGEWVLKELEEERDTFLPYVTDYNYDDILLLWHIATELCFNDREDKVTNKERGTAKQLSDYMLYLMVMKPDMMSGVSRTGEMKFQETCTEVSKFFDSKSPDLIKKRKFCNFSLRERKEVKEALQIKACDTILCHKTEAELANLCRDRTIFLTASVLAKKLKMLPSERKWLIISKLWVELLSYAASHIRSSAHTIQLTRGGELITIVWLLMAHFGLGDEYEIDPAGTQESELSVE